MAVKGRFSPNGHRLANGRLRRMLPVADRASEGHLTEPTADAGACRWELVNMPQLGPCADRCRAVLKVSRAGLTSRWFRLYGGARTQFLEIARDDRLTFLYTFIHHHELAVSRAQLDHALLRGITGSDDVDEFSNLVRADRGLRHEQRIGPITDVHAGADILPWQQRQVMIRDHRARRDSARPAVDRIVN